MKNVKLLFMMSLLFLAEIGFSQNYVTYSSKTGTVTTNSGVEGSLDIIISCYGNSSNPVILDQHFLCGDPDGFLSNLASNGLSLTPGQTTTLKFKFKKTVTSDTQKVYNFTTNGSCSQKESEMIKITVNYKAVAANPITNNYISGNQTVYEGQTTSILSGSTPSGGNETFSYIWQKKKVGDGAYSIISGATGINYSPGILASTTSFKRSVTSAGLTNTSAEITLTVAPAPFVQNNTISIDGITVTGSLPTGGLGTNSYQYTWYIIDQDGDGSQLPDTSQSLILTEPTFTRYFNSPNNFTLKRMVTSGSQYGPSNAVAIPHISAIQNNIISVSNKFVTGSTPTGGLGTYTYSWAIYYTGDAIDFDETTKDLDLTSHLNQINTILQIDSAAKLVRIVTAGISSASNKLSLSGVSAKTSNKENTLTAAIYPNPTSDSVNFTTSSSSNQEIEIIVYSEGLRNAQSVFKGTATPNQIIKWDIPSNYSKGIYYYKVISDNKEVKSGKILYQ